MSKIEQRVGGLKFAIGIGALTFALLPIAAWSHHEKAPQLTVEQRTEQYMQTAKEVVRNVFLSGTPGSLVSRVPILETVATKGKKVSTLTSSLFQKARDVEMELRVVTVNSVQVVVELDQAKVRAHKEEAEKIKKDLEQAKSDLKAVIKQAVPLVAKQLAIEQVAHERIAHEQQKLQDLSEFVRKEAKRIIGVPDIHPVDTILRSIDPR